MFGAEQATSLTRANADPVHWRIYVALGEMSWSNSSVMPHRHWFNRMVARVIVQNPPSTVMEYPNTTLQWRHNGRDDVSNHQPHDCLLNRLFRRRSKKTSKLRVTSLCAGNSSVTGEFPAQMDSNAENVYIWWRHHETTGKENESLARCLAIDCCLYQMLSS